jgi:large subunit ribosomal protein L25
MRREITVAAEVRGTRGKNEARRTRRRGLIPAVVYGSFQDPVSVAVSPKELIQILRSSTGYNTIFNLAINGGETTPCMLVDEQFDPIKGSLLHADLKRIDLTKRLRVTVPVTPQARRRESSSRAACSRSSRARWKSRRCRTRFPRVSWSM